MSESIENEKVNVTKPILLDTNPSEENNKNSSTIENTSQFFSTNALLKEPQVREALLGAKETINQVLGIDIPEETLIQIASLFSLPDEYFTPLADEFIETIEKTYNDPAQRIALNASLQNSSLELMDLVKVQEVWNQQIDNQLDTGFSKVKKDFLKRIFSVVVNAMMDIQGESKRVIQIPITLKENATMPQYANVSDAGADVYATEDITINPGETKIIKTGIKVEIPKGYEIQVRPRSGLSAKSKLRISNAPGTIDSGYRDEIGIICENTDSKIRDIESHYDLDGKLVIDSIVYGSPITIEKGQRIAQLVLSEVPTMNFTEVSEISNKDNRNGGFGSTGE